jgi:hypothetical protein
MSETTKEHFYLQTARSVALVDRAWCGGKVMLYAVPPEKAISIENAYIHFKATFDVSVPIGNRKVKRIAIVDKQPLLYDSNADLNYYRWIDVNVVADPVTRKVDIKLDLSHLLKKTNAKYREYVDSDSAGGFTYVMIEPDDSLIGNNNIGRIDLWKLDAQFTTLGTQ